MTSQELNITIENVSKKYWNKFGIENVNTRFDSGYINLVVGPNGSGKSTLLKCIMGLVKYEGIITKKQFKIGYAPEQYVMPPFMSVLDFLVSIGRVKSIESESVSRFIQDYLVLFELEEHKFRLIGKLSNGMKQKVNLLQAMMHQPKIILLDEPLSALDLKSQQRIISLIKETSKKTLVIISTHQPEKFKTKRKRIYHFENGILTNEISF